MKGAIGAEDSVAGDNQGQAVAGHHAANGTGGIWPAGGFGQLLVSHCFAISYFHTGPQDFLRKRRIAGQVDGFR